MLWRSLCKMPDLLCISTLTRALASMTWTHLRQRDFKTIKEELWLWPPKTWDPEVSETTWDCRKCRTSQVALQTLAIAIWVHPSLRSTSSGPKMPRSSSKHLPQSPKRWKKICGPWDPWGLRMRPAFVVAVATAGSLRIWKSQGGAESWHWSIHPMIPPAVRTGGNLYLVKQIRERWTDSCLDCCQHFSPEDEEVINHQPPWLFGEDMTSAL